MPGVSKKATKEKTIDRDIAVKLEGAEGAGACAHTVAPSHEGSVGTSGGHQLRRLISQVSVNDVVKASTAPAGGEVRRGKLYGDISRRLIGRMSQHPILIERHAEIEDGPEEKKEDDDDHGGLKHRRPRFSRKQVLSPPKLAVQCFLTQRHSPMQGFAETTAIR